jgi:hypothetical protein
MEVPLEPLGPNESEDEIDDDDQGDRAAEDEVDRHGSPHILSQAAL